MNAIKVRVAAFTSAPHKSYAKQPGTLEICPKMFAVQKTALALYPFQFYFEISKKFWRFFSFKNTLFFCFKYINKYEPTQKESMSSFTNQTYY